MALVHASYTLAADTAALIATVPLNNPTTSVVVTNADSAAIYLGGSTLVSGAAAGRGIKVAAGGSQLLWLNGGETLYAISVAGTAAYTVAVLYSPVLPA